MGLVAQEPVKIEIVMALVQTLPPFWLNQIPFYSSTDMLHLLRGPVNLSSSAELN